MLEKKTDTAESAEFWAAVARVRKGTDLWPDWKRQLLETDNPLARPAGATPSPIVKRTID
jgi:hypothetical protein